jgi:hypothetical protein
MTDMIEWFCEVTLQDVPPPGEGAREQAYAAVRGVMNYDATARELIMVFRISSSSGAALVVSEALGRSMEALSWLRPVDASFNSAHHLKDFRVRPADTVPVDPDVQRYIDQRFGKDR